jgi:hypothetical protein
MGEGADDRRVDIGAKFAAEIGTGASRLLIVGVDRVVHDRNSARGNSFRDQILPDGIRARDQVTLLAMPLGGGEAVDVADRRRATKPLEPAAPPTSGRQMRMEQVGLKAMSGKR